VTQFEASQILCAAKWVMVDMGMILEADEAEDAELMLLRCTAQDAHARADYLLPKGRKGRCWLVLLRPEQARARAFTAAVLRAVE
jgi:hypothetical protein